MYCDLSGGPVSYLPQYLHTFTEGLDAVLGDPALTAGKKKKDLALALMVPTTERER